MKKQKFKWDLNSSADRTAIVEQVAGLLGYEALTHSPSGAVCGTQSGLSIVSHCEFAPLRIEFNFKTGARCYVAGYTRSDSRHCTETQLEYHCGHKCRKETARAQEWGCVIKRNSDPADIASALREKITVAERLQGIPLRDRRIVEARQARERADAMAVLCGLFGFADNPNARPRFHVLDKVVPGYRIEATLQHAGDDIQVVMQVTMSAADAGEAVGYLTAIPSVAVPGAT